MASAREACGKGLYLQGEICFNDDNRIRRIPSTIQWQIIHACALACVVCVCVCVCVVCVCVVRGPILYACTCALECTDYGAGGVLAARLRLQGD